MPLIDHWYVGDDAGASNNTSYTVYGTTWYSQTFTTIATYDIASVKLRLRRVGVAGALNFNVEIRTTTTQVVTTAKPTATVLCSGSVAAGDIGTSDSTGYDVIIPISSPTSLTTGTMYAIVVSYPDGDASHYVQVREDNASTLYTGGSIIVSGNSGSTWGSVTTTLDALFATYSAAETLHIEGSIDGVSVWSGTAGLFEILHAVGEITGVSVWAGTADLLEFVYVTGVISGVSSWAGDLTFPGGALLAWPPLRGRIPADDDTLHNSTLIAVGFDADGLGIIYFKET